MYIEHVHVYIFTVLASVYMFTFFPINLPLLPHAYIHTLQLLILVNGRDCFTYRLPLPSGPTTASTCQYYIAGGAVSRHISERHIQLVNADSSHISWRIGSLQVLKGKTTDFTLVCNVHISGLHCYHMVRLKKDEAAQQNMHVYFLTSWT